MRRRGIGELAADSAARGFEHSELYVPDESGPGVIRGSVSGNVFDYCSYEVRGNLDNHNGRASELFREADGASGGNGRRPVLTTDLSIARGKNHHGNSSTIAKNEH